MDVKNNDIGVAKLSEKRTQHDIDQITLAHPLHRSKLRMLSTSHEK
jgi:hypothetical protein